MSPMSSQPLSKTFLVCPVCMYFCLSFFLPYACLSHSIHVSMSMSMSMSTMCPSIQIPCHAWLSLLYFTDKKSGNPPPLDYITITVGCPRKFALSTMAASPPMSNVVTFP